MALPEGRRAGWFTDHGWAGGPRDGRVAAATVSLGAARSCHLARQRDPERVAVPGLLLDGRLDVARVLPERLARGAGVGRGCSHHRGVRRHPCSRAPKSARSAGDRAGARPGPGAAVARRRRCATDRTKPALGTDPVGPAAPLPSRRQAHFQPQLRRSRPPQPPRSLPASARRQRRADTDPPARRRLLARARAQELLRAAAPLPACPPGLGLRQRHLPGSSPQPPSPTSWSTSRR
jgi:hypothetical protein